MGIKYTILNKLSRIFPPHGRSPRRLTSKLNSLSKKSECIPWVPPVVHMFKSLFIWLVLFYLSVCSQSTLVSKENPSCAGCANEQAADHRIPKYFVASVIARRQLLTSSPGVHEAPSRPLTVSCSETDLADNDATGLLPLGQ